ncbi:MAG: ParA family protein [Flavobacteriaceae bacterium]
MTAQVISVIQSKGGAGKTTLLLTIATHMYNDGAKIAVIDTDPQKSTYRFCESFDHFDFDYDFIGEPENIGKAIKQLRDSGYDAIFVDSAGYKSSMVTFITSNSDLILIPSKADTDNALGAVKTFGLIEATCENMGKSIKVKVVMMDIDKNTNITKDIVNEFKKGEIPMLNKFVGHATGYKELLTKGVVHTSGAFKNNTDALMCEFQLNNMINFYNNNLKVVANG